jgi:hypothetical protein
MGLTKFIFVHYYLIGNSFKSNLEEINYKNMCIFKILNLGIHVKVMVNRLYKIDHNYFTLGIIYMI